jgi:tRNA pseudouridine55 synthase
MTRTVHRDGIILIDKPSGCTSHDVVSRMRRSLGTREVGHAGTLDPMATGLLVLLVGEATKLSQYLTADSKEYRATVRFGAITDSLDADGVVIQASDAPAPTHDQVERAISSMVGAMEQIPPMVSAIKRDGVAIYERARRGEIVEMTPRSVVLEHARVLAVREGECDLEVRVSKGFYVRSLARDLAASLGTLGYLSALRRTRSGVFSVDDALRGSVLWEAAGGDAAARSQVEASLWPMASAKRALRELRCDPGTALALSQGKRVTMEQPDGIVLAVNAETEQLICIARIEAGVISVLRGFQLRA